MGDQVAEISYGVTLNEGDYNKLSDELFETVQRPGETWSSSVEKDKQSFLTIEQPYETEDYLLVVRTSQQSSYNGTVILDKLADDSTTANWSETIKNFLKERGIEPESDCGWMLTAHYG